MSVSNSVSRSSVDLLVDYIWVAGASGNLFVLFGSCFALEILHRVTNCKILRKLVRKNLQVKKKSVPLQSDSKKLFLRHGFGPRIDSLAQ